jgi:hypothetical protein
VSLGVPALQAIKAHEAIKVSAIFIDDSLSIRRFANLLL